MDLINPLSLLYPSYVAAQAKNQILYYYLDKSPTSEFLSDTRLEATSEASLSLWNYKRLMNSVYHPTTNEPVPLLFRMSAFLPVNIPILAGILLFPGTSVLSGFWQVLHQCYFAGFNYHNGNLSSSLYDDQELFGCYYLAILGSVVVGVKVHKLFQHSKSLFVCTFGHATALATAGCVNLLIMRHQELFEGVRAYNYSASMYDESKEAAKKGLSKTAFIRFTMQYPLVFFPVIVREALKKVRLYPGAGLGKVCMDVGLVSLSLLINVPVMFALYPHIMHAEKLEKRWPQPGGFYFNRGL